MIFSLKDFTYKIDCDDAVTDAVVETEINGDHLDLYLTASADKPKYIRLKWNTESADGFLVLGDAWERTYGNLEFLPVERNDRYMPWYFIATNKVKSMCFGVKTAPNAFVSFRFDGDGLRATLDCRNGGKGVHLNFTLQHLSRLNTTAATSIPA